MGEYSVPPSEGFLVRSKKHLCTLSGLETITGSLFDGCWDNEGFHAAKPCTRWRKNRKMSLDVFIELLIYSSM